jgi:uncharacterized protein (DUF983 family)
MAGRRRCPRCGGNLFLSMEDPTAVWGCLQCGRQYPVRQAVTQTIGRAVASSAA